MDHLEILMILLKSLNFNWNVLFPSRCSATAFPNPEIGPFKKPRLKPAAQAQGRLGSNGLGGRRGGGLFLPRSPNCPAHGQVTLKDARSLLQEPVLHSLSLLISYTPIGEEKMFTGRAYDGAVPTPPAPGRRRFSLASGGARLIYIFRGGGRAAAPSPGQCVN